MVEIAYGIAPDYEGRGYATAAACALIEYAKGTGQVSSLARLHPAAKECLDTRLAEMWLYLCRRGDEFGRWQGLALGTTTKCQISRRFRKFGAGVKLAHG